MINELVKKLYEIIPEEVAPRMTINIDGYEVPNPDRRYLVEDIAKKAEQGKWDYEHQEGWLVQANEIIKQFYAHGFIYKQIGENTFMFLRPDDSSDTVTFEIVDGVVKYRFGESEWTSAYWDVMFQNPVEKPIDNVADFERWCTER